MFSQASFICASLQALFTFPETTFTWTVSRCFHKLLLFSHHFRHSSHFRRHLLHELFRDVFTSFFYFRITSDTLHIFGDIFTQTVSWCFHKLLLFLHHFRKSSHFRIYLLPAMTELWSLLHNFFKFLDQGIFCCEISLNCRMFTKSLRLNSVSYRVKLWSVYLTQSLTKSSIVFARQTSVWLLLTWSTQFSRIQSQSLSFDGNLHISGDIFYQQWRSYDLYYFFKLLDQGIFCCEFIAGVDIELAVAKTG